MRFDTYCLYIFLSKYENLCNVYKKDNNIYKVFFAKPLYKLYVIGYNLLYVDCN